MFSPFFASFDCTIRKICKQSCFVILLTLHDIFTAHRPIASLFRESILIVIHSEVVRNLRTLQSYPSINGEPNANDLL